MGARILLQNKGSMRYCKGKEPANGSMLISCEHAHLMEACSWEHVHGNMLISWEHAHLVGTCSWEQELLLQNEGSTRHCKGMDKQKPRLVMWR